MVLDERTGGFSDHQGRVYATFCLGPHLLCFLPPECTRTLPVSLTSAVAQMMVDRIKTDRVSFGKTGSLINKKVSSWDQYPS